MQTAARRWGRRCGSRCATPAAGSPSITSVRCSISESSPSVTTAIAVLDGRIAWVGGHCIVDEWLREVRDLSVRLRGPIVHAVQSAFSENWVEVTGELFAGDGAFPSLENAGDIVS